MHTKIGFSYPVNPHLKTLLDMILKDSRWDMKFLGMQIMVEGLALAAFGMIRNNTDEPLLKALTAYVMGDEARHVAFGVLSLRDYYRDSRSRVKREREDFVYEAARLMRDRFLFQEVWEKLGLPAKECMDIALHNQGQVMFRQMLFAKIVPAIKKMDLLSERQRAALRGARHPPVRELGRSVRRHRAEPAVGAACRSPVVRASYRQRHAARAS